MDSSPFVVPRGAVEESLTLLGGESLMDMTIVGYDSCSVSLSQTLDDGISELEGTTTPALFEPTRSRHITIQIPKSTLVNPKSTYEGFTPPLPQVREHVAVKDLLATIKGKPTKEEYVEFELNEFSFYIEAKLYPEEMRPLHHMSTKVAHDRFYFDGIISSGNTKRYVAKVEVSEIPIGNYGTSSSSVDDQIWIRSRLNSNKEIYYKLKKPALEYKRFHTPFLWVANLAKHFVDFCDDRIEKSRDVTLRSFKREFIEWLLETHKRSSLESWLEQHPSTDFRTSIIANLEFLWKELHGVLPEKKVMDFKLFREARSFSQYSAVPPLTRPKEMVRRTAPKEEEEAPTIVTPYIKECFGHMAIGEMLRLAGDDEEISLPETDKTKSCEEGPERFLSREEVSRVKVGDVIATPRDIDNPYWGATILGRAVDDGRWFGLVQRIHVTKQGHRDFDVRWLYRPADTLCSILKYPWPNELFLSDNCTCEDGSAKRIKENQVSEVVPVTWFGNPNNSGDQFFVRQMYLVECRRFVTLEKSHQRCSHEDGEKPGFRAGDTILAVLRESEGPTLAEPYEVVKVFRQNDRIFVRLRRLLRRSRADATATNAPPNELVYTEELVVHKLANINVIGKCHVRFCRHRELIPSPYDRGGTGNLFFITHTFVDGRIVPFEGEFPKSLRQGFDPSAKARKLRGLDLFCGAGNFGRGLEESGAVDMRWANDIWGKAIHTYMANTPSPETTHPFLGSIDDLLRKAIQGDFSNQVPRPGEVDFISAGSPCPGFSLLTADKSTLKQIKNRSLIASFASFVDFYRPKYAILENVSTIIQTKKNREQDILCQLFCALLGMGYQTQLVLGDAWSHGAPQTRNRVFLCIAAPGYRLPEGPVLSHSHFPGVQRRTLGDNVNVPFVERQFRPTAFKYVTAEESTADLQDIQDGNADCCPGFPDHRLSRRMNKRALSEITNIPVQPWGMNFAKAWYGMRPTAGKGGQGAMSAADRELFPATGQRVSNKGQGYSRQRPNQLFRTVTTSCNWTDARCGEGLHWREPRPLSIMEVRRAQGFLDHEVLLGTVMDQWRLVGNSVARPMALALGLKFREAWLGSLCEGAPQEALGDGQNKVDGVLIEEEALLYESTPLSGSRNPNEAEEASETGDSTPATEVEFGADTAWRAQTGVKRRFPDHLTNDDQRVKTRKVSTSPQDTNEAELGLQSTRGVTIVRLD
ncbi:hypothetical protein OQA88_9854 [Cercophora sp. LCS_1]